MTCSVELLCIGNELLVGKTTNTNATWLAKKITVLGGSVKRVTTVGDYVNEIQEATEAALVRRPDFLITTGGLGPTFDDTTIAGVSKAVKLRLRINKEALTQIRARYRRIFHSKRFILSKFRLKMAAFPTGARPLSNPVGTAPAMMLQSGKTTIIALPGVPKELRAVFSEHVAPLIRDKAGTGAYVSQTIQVTRIFESELAPLIDRVMKQQPEVYVKSHPQGGEGRGTSLIRLDFSYIGHDPTKGHEVISEAIAHMRRLLAVRVRQSARKR